MNKDKAMLWVRALRSGEFKQGKSTFYRPKEDAYCVNGVLCMLALLDGACDYSESDLHGYFDGYCSRLPDSVKAWAEMKTTGTIPGEELSLSGLNDLAGWDFEELASLIEVNYEQI